MDKYCSINKNFKHSNVKFLLSTSFFYLSNSYKSTHKYVNGIFKIIKFINLNKLYGLRIYYDKSIFLNPIYKKLFNKIIKNPF